jgi:5-methylcytosine-specific restriction protein A
MRREFPKATKLAAWVRCNGLCEATLPDGTRCGARLTVGKFRYDHRIPDQMGGEPTLENCLVACVVCDVPKTAKDQGDIAEAKRREAAYLGANPAPSRPLQSRGFQPTQRGLDRAAVEKLPLPQRRPMFEREDG